MNAAFSLCDAVYIASTALSLNLLRVSSAFMNLTTDESFEKFFASDIILKNTFLLPSNSYLLLLAKILSLSVHAVQGDHCIPEHVNHNRSPSVTVPNVSI